MGQIVNQAQISVDDLVPYANNAKRHTEAQVKQIADSIAEFGFLNPVLIDKDRNIIAGHGRVMAAKNLGITSVPCVYVEGLSEAQRRAYILADNRLTELGEWDMSLVAQELEGLEEFGFNTALTGFVISEGGSYDWFRDHERNDTSRQEGNDEYNEFLDKFEEPKTTDDCYTPDKVYDAVVEWIENEYGVKRVDFVRPFYPGGDFERFEYPKNCIVVDNPPFSILSEILKFYDRKKIKFFLFAPALTLFSSSSSACAIGAGAQVVYENGASVSTSFLTNLEDIRFRTAPTLTKAVNDAVEEILKEQRRELPKNDYPDTVITSPKLSYFSKYGVDFRVSREESAHIRALDEQKESGKGIFGSGYLISEKAAAEKAAAEKAAAEKAAALKWKLSEREQAIVDSLQPKGV